MAAVCALAQVPYFSVLAVCDSNLFFAQSVNVEGLFTIWADIFALTDWTEGKVFELCCVFCHISS